MHKTFVPETQNPVQQWEGLKNDLHRGAVVGSPKEVEWHPHPEGQPCGEECRTVTLKDLQ